MGRVSLPVLAAFLLLSVYAFAGGPVQPPGPVPITCTAGDSVVAYPGYGQALTCGTALATGTISAGAAPQIAQYTAATTVGPATLSGDATIAAGGALTVSKIGGNAVTLGGALTTVGAFATTFTMTAATGVTFPTTGTLATLAGAEAFTNKTLTAPTIAAGALSGTFSGAPTLSGNLTFSGVPIFTGLSAGTIAAGKNLGLDASNNLVTATVSGGGSVSVTAATPNIVVTPSPGTGTFTVGTTIPQNSPADGGSHSYTLLAGDITKQVILASTFTAAAVPQATGSFAAGSAFDLRTKGAGTATSTTSTINNIAGATGIKFGANQEQSWVSDGTNWLVALGVPQPATQTGTTFLKDDMTWGTPAGAGDVSASGTLTSGKIIIGGGTTVVSADASAGLVAGALSLGASGTAGSVAMGNATSGTITLQPVAGALGTVTASLPANTGTIAELNLAQGWTAAQTFTAAGPLVAGANGGNVGSLKLFGNTSGDATITVPAAAGTATRFQLPATNGSNTNVLQTDGSGNTSWAAAGAGGTIIANSIGGLTLSNDGVTPNTILDIAAGTAADSTNAAVISIGAFTKTISGAWTSGTGNAGMGNGLTATLNTWYHVCLWNNGGTADISFDTSVTCANRPAGISDTKYRRIGSILLDASVHIYKFIQRGDTFIWDVQKLDASNQTYSTGTNVTLSVPPGAPMLAYLLAYNGTAAAAIVIFDPDSHADISGAGYGQCQTPTGQSPGSCIVVVMTNSSGQITAAGAAGASTASVYINTYQYRDFRGQL